MRGVWALTFTIIITPGLGLDCNTIKDGLANFEADFDYVWEVVRDESGSVYPSLKITWVLKPNSANIDFDGWVYSLDKQGDGDDDDYYSGSSDEYYSQDNASKNPNCTATLNESSKHENLTKEKLADICDKLQTCECPYSNYYCDDKRIPKDKNRLTERGEFGVSYNFWLGRSQNFIFGKGQPLQSIRPVFCVQHQVENGKTIEDARNECNGTSNSEYLFGPVYNATAFRYDFNLSSLSVMTTIKWQAPLDIKSKENDIKVYKICRLDDYYHWKPDGIKNASDRGVDLSYEYQISSPPAQTLLFLIIPNSAICTRPDYAFVERLYIDIPDIENPCSVPNTPSYCDANAMCNNKSASRENPPDCDCYYGFEGDGVNRHWNGSATGCQVKCATKSKIKNHTCHELARCFDRKRGVICNCRSGYIGDGYRNGSGCSKAENGNISSPSLIALPIIASSAFLLFLVIYGFILTSRRHQRKKRGSVYKGSLKMETSVNSDPVLVNKLHRRVFGVSELNANDVILQDVLGRGAFSVVYRALLRTNTTKKGDEKTVAVKVANASTPENEFFCEIGLFASIRYHDNVLKIIGFVIEEKTMLVMEYMRHGDLLHFLWNARDSEKHEEDDVCKLTEEEVYNIGRQVASGMQHLVGSRVIHGDLAARNILVGKKLVVKISDFGLANDVYRYGVIKNRAEKKVPYKWISPERMALGRVPITWRSDVWSFGILLYETITLGDTPFSGIPRDALCDRLRAGYRMEKPSDCTDYLYKIMRRCWEWVPSKRPTFQELQEQLVPQQNDMPYHVLQGNTLSTIEMH